MSPNIAYIIAPVIAFSLAQLIKYMLDASPQRSWKYFFKSGNMPSGHSATVLALSSVVFADQGLSELFAITIVFSMTIIYDALVARRSIGEQGQALIRLIEKSPFAKDPMPRVALGHKPLEVLAGSTLGIIVGLLVALFITK